ncbi:hypothetical protein evm_006743 [Chilo suppressalis]|nr:hypothetical protein evm_006743 [Chilo suppressalis]
MFIFRLDDDQGQRPKIVGAREVSVKYEERKRKILLTYKFTHNNGGERSSFLTAGCYCESRVAVICGAVNGLSVLGWEPG